MTKYKDPKSKIFTLNILACFLERRARHMKSPFYMTFPLISFGPIGGFYEIQQGGNAVEGYFSAMLFYPVASTVTKWRTYKFLRWIQSLHQTAWGHYILCAN
jgi:hypothetical protein